MAIVVVLQDLVDAIDSHGAEAQFYVDLTTGAIAMITEDDLSLADANEARLARVPDWQREGAARAKLVEEQPERFLAVPDSRDVNEWQMMARFAEARSNTAHRDELERAIHGSGAFRFFRATADRLGLLDEWYAFRQAEYEQVATDWLNEHGIPYVERAQGTW